MAVMILLNSLSLMTTWLVDRQIGPVVAFLPKV